MRSTPSSDETIAFHEPRRYGPLAIVGLSVIAALAIGIGLRFAWNAVAKPAPPGVDPPEEAVALQPVVSDNEKFLLLGVAKYANPKPDEVADGVKHHLRLGLLYLNESRFADAEKFAEEMIHRPAVQPPYRVAALLLQAIATAMRGDAEKSYQLFQDVKGTSPSLRTAMIVLQLRREDLIEVNYWIVRALDRDTLTKPIPGPLAKVREEIGRSRFGASQPAKKGEP